MKNTLTMRKITAYVLFTLMLMLFALPTQMFYANALENDNPPIGATLYYFSDSPHATTYRTNLLSGGYVTNCYLYNYDTNNFEENIKALYNQNYLSAISNAYIIFEMRRGFSHDKKYPGHLIFTDYLKNIFSEMKSNGCSIFFICGTSEALFYDYNEFLDYVDTHISCPVFDTFVLSIFKALNDRTDYEKLQNCTILLDDYFSNGIIGGYKNAWFFYNYFIPYFRNVYRTKVLQGKSSRQIYSEINLKILCYDAERNDFLDISSIKTNNENTYYNWDNGQNAMLEFIRNDLIISIGTSRNSATRAQTWIDKLQALTGDMVIYMLNDDGYSLTCNEDMPTYFTGPILDYYDIMVDFLTNVDLMSYNNLEGRAAITYFAMPQSSNGWMANLMNYVGIGSDTEFDLSPFLVYREVDAGEDDEDDYNHNYSDAW